MFRLVVAALLWHALGCDRVHQPREEALRPTVTAQTPQLAPTAAMTPPAQPPQLAPSTRIAPANRLRLVEGGTAHFFPETASASRRRPLLLFLHGLGADGKLAFNILKLEELARREQIYVVAPDGERDSRGQRFWNAHPACCNFDRLPIDHVASLKQVVDELVANAFVDVDHVYVMGISNGGFMAHRLACDWGDWLAGAVSIAGAGPDEHAQCKTSRRLRVAEMHGDVDATVRYEGGTLFNRPPPQYSSARDTLQRWAKRLGCVGTPKELGPIDLDPRLAGAETEVSAFEHCPRGSTSLWTVRGGNHMFGNRPTVVEKAWLYLNSDPK